MLAALTGLGLSSAAGLNAYIPLLMVGLAARFTELVPLGESWQWLEHPATLITLTLLLIVEFVADKVPALDSVNDVVQTAVRPTSGGITFGAGASSLELTEITEAAGTAGTSAAAAGSGGGGTLWGAVVAGAVIALAIHIIKSLARPVANTASFGFAAPVASVAEDFVSAVNSLLAVLVPVLIAVVFPLMLLGGVWVLRRRRRMRQERRQVGDNAR